MEEMNGFEVMEQITHEPDTLVIVITGFVSIGSAIEALRKGAYDLPGRLFAFDLMRSRSKGPGKSPTLEAQDLYADPRTARGRADHLT